MGEEFRRDQSQRELSKIILYIFIYVINLFSTQFLLYRTDFTRLCFCPGSSDVSADLGYLNKVH